MTLMPAPPPAAPAAPDRLASLAARLAAPRRDIERDFVQMGEKLIACTRLLSETSEAYGQMSGALTGPEFSDLTAALERVSDHAASLSRERNATQDFLSELKTLTEQFPQRIDALSKAVRVLRMFFVTARVAAATSGNRENGLLQFVEEFSNLGGLLDGNVKSFADAFTRMRDSLGAAAQMNDQFGAQHTQLLSGIADQQARNLAAMESRRVWAAGRIAAHDDRSGRINARVGRAVSTLQVGDSTRQRVEHVEEGLQKLLAGADAPTTAIVCALMAAQLHGAIADFDSETGDLATSLHDLLEDTEAMLHSAATDSETLLSDGDSALGAIGQSLQDIARMVEQYERSNAALSVAIDQLVAAVGNMLDHVSAFDAIRQKVRLLSMNATLSSRALDDDGRAFRQVAKDLRALNDETNAPVGEVMEKLERSAEILRFYLDSRSTAGGARTPALQEALESARQQIDRISGLLRDRAAVMGATGSGALDRLRDAAATVTGRTDLCGEWRAVAADLAAAADGPDFQAAGAPATAQVLAEIHATYTMRAERDIHNDCLGVTADDPPDTGGDTGAGAGDLDDIFF